MLNAVIIAHVAQLQALLATAKNKAEKGQGLAEYGLILALVAVVCIAGLTALGDQLNAGLDSLAGTLGGTIAG